MGPNPRTRKSTKGCPVSNCIPTKMDEEIK